jgi:hypothetical protein
VLQLMDDVVAWRVFDFQRGRGNDRFAEPERPRPPEIANLWHNGFRDQVRANAGEIEDLLAARASVLAASEVPAIRELAPLDRELATSVREGLELSQRVGPEQLGIPLNAQFKGRLALVRKGQDPARLGRLRLSVIGPFPRDLDALRREWNEWVADHRREVAGLRREMARDARRLAAADMAALNEPLAQAAQRLGQRAKVTVPNLASLMLHVQEGRRTVLLTGDGHWQDILDGLEATGKAEPGRTLHVDVLKVQHHGSEHNLSPEFLDRVTADTYVFCANGQHDNPDLRVVQALVDSIGTRPAALRFNSSPRAAPGPRERKHMAEVERIVTEAEARSGARLSHAFLDEDSFSLEVG